MADIFISYAQADRAIARRFAAALESHGLSVWWDQRLHSGQPFDRIIEDAIDAARAVVVLWSKHSAKSDWVRAEAAAGLEAKKLVPVRIDSSKPPLRYRNIQIRNLVSWAAGEPASSLQELLSDLHTVIGSGPLLDDGKDHKPVYQNTRQQLEHHPERHLIYRNAAIILICGAGIIGMIAIGAYDSLSALLVLSVLAGTAIKMAIDIASKIQAPPNV
jgi:hypothetical protein